MSELPKGWRRVPFEEAADVVRGITFPATAKSAPGTPGAVVCLRTSNVQRELLFDDVLHVPGEYVRRDDQWLRHGDIVMSMANSQALVGKVALAWNPPPRTTFGGFLGVLRPRSVDPRYLHHAVRSPDVARAIRATASQTVNIANISVRGLRDVQLPIAPLPEQRRIVAEIETQFSRLDAAVASLQRVKVNLKRARASVLKAAVEGRLVPTEAALAKADGRAYEPAEKLLERILEERRRRWSESGAKGRYQQPEKPELTSLPVPEGWTWATMPQLGELDRGKSKHRPRNDPRLLGGPYPFIQTGDVRQANGTIRIFSATYSAFGLAQSRLWPAGTLCITIAANIAETAILGIDACFPDSVVGFSGLCAPVTVRFLEMFMRTERRRIAEFAPATAQKNINLQILRKVAAPIPPLAEQHRIVAEVERRLSVLDAVEAATDANLTRCERLRQSVLKMAFEGRLVPQDVAAERSRT